MFEFGEFRTSWTECRTVPVALCGGEKSVYHRFSVLSVVFQAKLVHVRIRIHRVRIRVNLAFGACIFTVILMRYDSCTYTESMSYVYIPSYERLTIGVVGV